MDYNSLLTQAETEEITPEEALFLFEETDTTQ